MNIFIGVILLISSVGMVMMYLRIQKKSLEMVKDMAEVNDVKVFPYRSNADMEKYYEKATLSCAYGFPYSGAIFFLGIFVINRYIWGILVVILILMTLLLMHCVDKIRMCLADRKRK